MEGEIKANLEKLDEEIQSFKNNNENKIIDQEKRLQNLENKYDVLGKRPFLVQDTMEDAEYKHNLREYLTKGIAHSAQVKSSGFPLRHQIITSLDKYLLKTSSMRQIASVDKVSADYVTYVRSKNYSTAHWTPENNYVADPRSASDDVYVLDIHTHEMYTQPKTTQRMLEDSSIDVESWIVEQAGVAFRKQEEKTFIIGDGSYKPRGILSYNQSSTSIKIDVVTTLNAEQISVDDIINLYYRLEPEFATNGTFLMNNFTAQSIRSLKYKQNGQYIWQPSLQEGEPDTLMGIPVVASSAMPLPDTSGNFAIAFGDFKQAYKIIDRTEMRILRDPYSNKPYVSFYITKRLGADILNADAIKLLQVK